MSTEAASPSPSPGPDASATAEKADSSSDDESSLSSSGLSSSSDSSDSESENENEGEGGPTAKPRLRSPPAHSPPPFPSDRKLSTESASAITIPSDARERAKAEPLNVNSTRALSRAKEQLNNEAMKPLGTRKRDRRTIEEIQRDLKRKRGDGPSASSASASSRSLSGSGSGPGAVLSGATTFVPKRPGPAPVPALRRSPPNRSPATSPEPDADRFGTSSGVGKKTRGLSARQRLLNKVNGRATRATAAVKSKKPGGGMASTASTAGMGMNLSKGTVITSRAAANDPDSLGLESTTARMEPKIEPKIVDAKPDVRVYRLLHRMLERYGDFADVDMVQEAKSADDNSFVQRSGLHGLTKMPEPALLRLAAELAQTAKTAIEEKRDVVKLADSETIKPTLLIERLRENHMLRVAMEHALIEMKVSLSKGATAAYILVDRWCDLSILGIDVRQCPPWTWAEKEHKWSSQKDAALLVGVYIHGFGAWEDIINDDKLGLDIRRGTKGERLKKRAELLLNKLPLVDEVDELPLVGQASALAAAAQGPSPAQLSAIISKAASKATDGMSQRVVDRSNIRRTNGKSSFDAGDPTRSGYTQNGVSSSSRRVPVSSPSISSTTRSDAEDNGDFRADPKRNASASRHNGKRMERSSHHASSGSKTAGSESESSPSKKVKLIEDAHSHHAKHRILTEEELIEKWKPSRKLKPIRRELKKLTAMQKWSQDQKDEVVVEKMFKYVTTIGDAIDRAVLDSSDKVHNSSSEAEVDELCTCLWTYAASHSPFSAVVFERLYDDICADGAKLREEAQARHRVATGGGVHFRFRLKSNMMLDTEAIEMTEEEVALKAQVTQTLERQGVLSKIKAQLRAAVFQALQTSSGASSKSGQPLLGTRPSSLCLAQHALETWGNDGELAMMLVEELLQWLDMEHTLHVLQAEAGREFKDKERLSAERLRDSLHFEGGEKSSSTPVLVEIVQRLRMESLSSSNRGQVELSKEEVRLPMATEESDVKQNKSVMDSRHYSDQSDQEGEEEEEPTSDAAIEESVASVTSEEAAVDLQDEPLPHRDDDHKDQWSIRQRSTEEERDESDAANESPVAESPPPAPTLLGALPPLAGFSRTMPYADAYEGDKGEQAEKETQEEDFDEEAEAERLRMLDAKLKAMEMEDDTGILQQLKASLHEDATQGGPVAAAEASPSRGDDDAYGSDFEEEVEEEVIQSDVSEEVESNGDLAESEDAPISTATPRVVRQDQDDDLLANDQAVDGVDALNCYDYIEQVERI